MGNGAKIILNYILAFVFIVLALYLVREVSNIFILSAALAALFVIALVYLTRNKKGIDIEGGGFLRYTLLCHNCNWEWMSNVTEDRKYSKKCPNCGDNSRIEVIGIRKVQKTPKKSHKDLTSFFKK